MAGPKKIVEKFCLFSFRDRDSLHVHAWQRERNSETFIINDDEYNKYLFMFLLLFLTSGGKEEKKTPPRAVRTQNGGTTASSRVLGQYGEQTKS